MVLLIAFLIIMMVIAVYWLLLPALNVKNPLLRIVIVGGLVGFLKIDSALLLLYTGATFAGTLFLLLVYFLREEKGSRLLYVIAVIPCIIFGLFLPLYLFSLIFAGDNFYYYVSFPMTIYFFIVLNALVKKYNWFKNYNKMASRACYLLTLLTLFGIWGYRHNPTTFLRTETVTLNGQTKTYSNTKILEPLKKIEQMIVLHLYHTHNDVTSVTFLSVRENADFRHPDNYWTKRFRATVLVNGDTKFYYDFDLSDNKETGRSSFYFTPVSSKSNSTDEVFLDQIADLDSPDSQDILKTIHIDYYLKNDIYKDFQENQ